MTVGCTFLAFGKESLTWAEGSRGQAYSGVVFAVKQCLHFIQRKACPARGSTAKL